MNSSDMPDAGMKFNDDGFAVPGSYAIGTVRLGGHMTDGSLAPLVTSAVCDVCGNWATELCTSGQSTETTGNIFDSRISKHVTVVVYACPDHYDQILNSLVDQYGHAGNTYEADELATAVNRESQARTRPC